MPLMAPSTYMTLAVEQQLGSGQAFQPDDLAYAEKPGGFQCRTCRYLTTVEGLHGGCALFGGRLVHLDAGCCMAWTYNPATHTEEVL